MEPAPSCTDRISQGAKVSDLTSSDGRAGVDIPVPRPEPAGEVVTASAARRASRPHLSRIAVLVAWTVALALPVIGLVSLFSRARLDPEWTGSRLHFVLFLAVGSGAFILAYVAGRAADRRGDARVFLLSLAFLVTGGFLAIHAIGTPGVLLDNDLPGSTVAIPVGLLVAALFAAASAFVDLRPGLAAGVVRHRARLRAVVLVTMAVWVIWTVAELPPLGGASGEGAGTVLRILAALGAAAYGASAARYLAVYRRRMTLLPSSVVTCFTLLAEALSGSALVGERTWHASWWEWHGLIVTAYVVVLFAARRQWSDERFHQLYLTTTRQRSQDLSVLFADLAGFTTFAEQSRPAEIATMLSTYYGMAAPLISRGYGGEVEKFIGDAIMATFNSRGDQPDHAVRAARASLELQHQMGLLIAGHPGWPKLRVGVNTGPALVREMGGPGYVAFAVVGDTINTASRLQAQAPLGGVLIGAGTYCRLPPHAEVEARPGLRVKGKQAPVAAYVLRSVPDKRRDDGRYPAVFQRHPATRRRSPEPEGTP
jgi:adenylate cyclase